MADAPQNPLPPIQPAGEQMRKSTGKVQPKKETVRINLPPKPTAAPTIKLPTLPPGGPTGAASGAPSKPTAPVPPPAGTPPLRSAAAPTVSTLDKILAISAAIMALAAVGTTVWMMLMLNNAVSQ